MLPSLAALQPGSPPAALATDQGPLGPQPDVVYCAADALGIALFRLTAAF
jgi:hypothetical protein